MFNKGDIVRVKQHCYVPGTQRPLHEGDLAIMLEDVSAMAIWSRYPRYSLVHFTTGPQAGGKWNMALDKLEPKTIQVLPNPEFDLEDMELAEIIMEELK